MLQADARAWGIVGQAVRNGTLVRPERCSECGKDCKPHAHHDDYSRPLDVRWLCGRCHSTAGPGINAETGPSGSRMLTMRWDEEFVAAIDRAREDVPRSAFVRRAVEQALGGGPGGHASSVTSPRRSIGVKQDRPTPSPAPAEQSYRQHVPGPNVENIRSSSQVSRSGPRPKGKK